MDVYNAGRTPEVIKIHDQIAEYYKIPSINLALEVTERIKAKDMPVDEMKVFFHQTIVAMSDTFNRATQDEKMTATMKDFCDYFAEKLEIKK